MLSHPLTNFEIQKYYKNEQCSAYSRINLHKVNNEKYVISPDKFK